MKVVHFIDGLRAGGKERQEVELLKGLVEIEDLELLVVTMDNETFYQPELDRLGLAPKRLKRRFRWDPLILRDFYRIVREFGADLIYANNTMSAFYALPVARWTGLKLINGSIRNAFRHRGFRPAFERLLLRLSDYRVANSNAGLESRGLSPDSPRNVVIYNGFDFSRAEHSESRSPSTAPGGDKKVVGMVATFSHYKDHDSFLAAARLILERRDDVIFLAIGGGELLEQHRQRLEERYRDRICLLGERKDVEALISTFDVGVLSTYTEGISNAVMEYMALAKPVVATDGGGTRELVEEGVTGFLVPPRSPEELADRVSHLLDNPSRAQAMGEAGKERLRKRFSSEELTANTVRLYRRALQSS